MVASDTVVGLVGAGILLVALIGVFVYESQQGEGGESDLDNAAYSVNTAGSTYENVAGTGTQLAPGQCVNNPPTTPCEPRGAQVAVTLAGLPSPGELHYVVFIEGSPDTRAVGEATPSGQNFVIGKKKIEGNFGTSPKLALCLESSGSATTCGWKVATFPVSGNAVAASGEAKFIASTGNHTVSFTASGTSTNVEAQLEDIENKTGYTYRGWMLRDDESGTNYTFVGNFTAGSGSSGASMDGSIRGAVPGARLDYRSFIVTIESSSAGIGLKPAGPPVIVGEYNPRETPAAQK